MAHPDIVYQNRPNYMSGRILLTNSEGILRITEVPRKRPKDMFRIAVVGDSVSACKYLEEDLRWTSLVEKALNEDPLLPGQEIQVLNFGVVGYDSRQEAWVVEHRVPAYEPNLILLQYCLNDPGVSENPQGCFVPLPEPRSHLIDLVLRKLGLRHRPVFVPGEGPGLPGHSYWANIYAPDSATWKKVVDAFGRIADATQGKVPVLLVLFPLFLDDRYPADAQAGYLQSVRRLGEEHGWGVLDLSESFAGTPALQLRSRPPDIYHPSPLGCRIAADAIQRHIREGVAYTPTGGLANR